jgi:hypothetical protein
MVCLFVCNSHQGYDLHSLSCYLQSFVVQISLQSPIYVFLSSLSVTILTQFAYPFHLQFGFSLHLVDTYVNVSSKIGAPVHPLLMYCLCNLNALMRGLYCWHKCNHCCNGSFLGALKTVA